MNELPRTSLLSMPRSMEAVRFRAPREAEVRGGTAPLIGRDDKPEQKVQMRLNAHCRIFDLLNPDELAEYEKVWQAIADDKAILAQHQLITSPDGLKIRAYLRWGDKSYTVQGQP